MCILIHSILRLSLLLILFLLPTAGGSLALSPSFVRSPPPPWSWRRRRRLVPEQRCFVYQHHHHHHHQHHRQGSALKSESTASTTPPAPSDDAGEQQQQQQQQVVGVVAPLLSGGPYPVLALRFPDLLRKDGVTVPVLRFVLDTGANVNTIDRPLVDALGLPLVCKGGDIPNLLGSAGAGGTFQPGDVHRLGDCQLDGLPPEQQAFTFMTNMTASALPNSAPYSSKIDADGLLSLPFFLSFPAGLEFDWSGTDGDPPTVVFYYGLEPPPHVLEGMTRVPLRRIAYEGVLALTLRVNGTDVPAVLDTGSPVTILTPQAAEAAGIDVVVPKEGDSAMGVIGVDHQRVTLVMRSVSADVSVRAGDSALGRGPVYVSDLPLLNLLKQLGDAPTDGDGNGDGGHSSHHPPAPVAVLGLDFLRQTYRMLLRASSNEVWFEAFPNQTKTNTIK